MQPKILKIVTSISNLMKMLKNKLMIHMKFQNIFSNKKDRNGIKLLLKNKKKISGSVKNVIKQII